MVYQYVGDSIMALFLLVVGHSDNAVESALHFLNDVIPEYNQDRNFAGYDPSQIGINSGLVATGIAALLNGLTVYIRHYCESAGAMQGLNIRNWVNH